jgi:hypothetical protein
MAQKFVVTIPVKPYVKRFIELNYGLPADFSSDPEIQREFRRCLKKPITRREAIYANREMCTYTQSLDIVISQDDFYRHGWEVSKTDTVTFGKIFESSIKCKMHNMVSIYRGVGLSIKDSIQKFQEHYHMEEEYWSYESIKKEYYRRRPDQEINFFVEIIGKIDTIFMDTLSRKKDNVPLKKTHHETVEQTI